MSSVPRSAPPSRPTTPLRAFNSHASASTSSELPEDSPLNALLPQFEEFADAFHDLDLNMQHIRLLTASLQRFTENFSAFLYALTLNAFCVDFPRTPFADSSPPPPAPPPPQTSSVTLNYDKSTLESSHSGHHPSLSSPSPSHLQSHPQSSNHSSNSRSQQSRLINRQTSSSARSQNHPPSRSTNKSLPTTSRRTTTTSSATRMPSPRRTAHATATTTTVRRIATNSTSQIPKSSRASSRSASSHIPKSSRHPHA